MRGLRMVGKQKELQKARTESSRKPLSREAKAEARNQDRRTTIFSFWIAE